MSILAFTNSVHTKESAVSLAKWHREQDSYMRGTYRKYTDEKFKGCSVGCMAEGKHKNYPTLFGIDARIAHISDELFENLNSVSYKDYTVELFESIKEGIDTELVADKLMLWILSDDTYGAVNNNSSQSIVRVIRLCERKIAGDIVSREDWAAAAAAASAAAYASADAADAAAAAAASAAAYASAAYVYADAAAAAAAAYASAAYAYADAAAAAAYAAVAAASAAASAAAAYAADAAASAKQEFYSALSSKLNQLLSGKE